MLLHQFLLVLAIVLALIASVWTPVTPRVHLGWLAIACFLLSELTGVLLP